MDRWLVSQVVDLATGRISLTNGQSVSPVQGNHRSVNWRVTVNNDGSPADLTGCECMVYANRSDGSTAVAPGNIDDNVCNAELPQQFFAVTGKLQLLMTLTNAIDGTTITISDIGFLVKRGPSDEIVDPGETFPDISQGLAAIAMLSSYMLTRTEVVGNVICEQTDHDVFSITYDDGEAYSFSVDNDTITFI